MIEKSELELARRRAKDTNKELGSLYVSQATKSISTFRNTIFLTSSFLLPYIQSSNLQNKTKVSNLILLSMTLGIIHFFIEYKMNIKNAGIHADIEKKYAVLEMSEDQYKVAYDEEQKLRITKDKGLFTLLLAIVEAVLVLFALYYLFS